MVLHNIRGSRASAAGSTSSLLQSPISKGSTQFLQTHRKLNNRPPQVVGSKALRMLENANQILLQGCNYISILSFCLEVFGKPWVISTPVVIKKEELHDRAKEMCQHPFFHHTLGILNAKHMHPKPFLAPTNGLIVIKCHCIQSC